MAMECRRQGESRCTQYAVEMFSISLRATSPIILIAGALTLGACGGNASDTPFAEQGAPFTFSYPSELHKVFADTGREFKGLDPTYRIAIGSDETNIVVVATYALKKDVATVNKTKLAVSVERAARALARAMKGNPPQRSETKLGALPATRYDFSAKDASLTTRLIYAFKGKTQYFVRCQWKTEQADLITAACDEVAKTFAPAD